MDICEENQLNELTTAYPEQDLAPSAEYDDQYDEGTGGSDGEDGADKEDATKVGNETKNNVMSRRKEGKVVFK